MFTCGGRAASWRLASTPARCSGMLHRGWVSMLTLNFILYFSLKNKFESGIGNLNHDFFFMESDPAKTKNSNSFGFLVLFSWSLSTSLNSMLTQLFSFYTFYFLLKFRSASENKHGICIYMYINSSCLNNYKTGGWIFIQCYILPTYKIIQ